MGTFHILGVSNILEKKKSGNGAGGGEFCDETDAHQTKMPNKIKEGTVGRKDWKWYFLSF